MIIVRAMSYKYASDDETVDFFACPLARHQTIGCPTPVAPCDGTSSREGV